MSEVKHAKMVLVEVQTGKTYHKYVYRTSLLYEDQTSRTADIVTGWHESNCDDEAWSARPGLMFQVYGTTQADAVNNLAKMLRQMADAIEAAQTVESRDTVATIRYKKVTPDE